MRPSSMCTVDGDRAMQNRFCLLTCCGDSDREAAESQQGGISNCFKDAIPPSSNTGGNLVSSPQFVPIVET